MGTKPPDRLGRAVGSPHLSLPSSPLPARSLPAACPRRSPLPAFNGCPARRPLAFPRRRRRWADGSTLCQAGRSAISWTRSGRAWAARVPRRLCTQRYSTRPMPSGMTCAERCASCRAGCRRTTERDRVRFALIALSFVGPVGDRGVEPLASRHTCSCTAQRAKVL